MHALGTIGAVRDNSATYAAGSFEVFVEFQAEGLHFCVHHFVRTDGACALDRVYLYVRHPSNWCDDLVKVVDPSSANLSRVDRRALHLLAVAEATSVEGIDARFAALELV